MNDFKFWMIFMVGVTTGATVALICAPQTGVKTRKQIKSKLNDASDYLQDQAAEASDYIKDQTAALSDQAAKVYKSTKEAAGDVSDNLAETLQSTVQSVKAKVK